MQIMHNKPQEHSGTCQFREISGCLFPGTAVEEWQLLHFVLPTTEKRLNIQWASLILDAT